MKNPILEKLATDVVGDCQKPNIFFVTTQRGVVKAIFANEEEAMQFARVVSSIEDVFVEDRLVGEVWTSC